MYQSAITTITYICSLKTLNIVNGGRATVHVPSSGACAKACGNDKPIIISYVLCILVSMLSVHQLGTICPSPLYRLIILCVSKRQWSSRSVPRSRSQCQKRCSNKRQISGRHYPLMLLFQAPAYIAYLTEAHEVHCYSWQCWLAIAAFFPMGAHPYTNDWLF